MQAPEYMTIKELKEILANMPDDYYACVEGGEDEHGGWGSFYISSQTPDHWMEADRITVLDY